MPRIFKTQSKTSGAPFLQESDWRSGKVLSHVGSFFPTPVGKFFLTQPPAREWLTRPEARLSRDLKHSLAFALSLARPVRRLVAGWKGNSDVNSERQDLLGKHVRFYLNDVFVPEPAQVLAELHGRDLLSGRIIDLTASGTQRDAFAVVEVERLSQPIVVPVAKIVEVAE